MSELEKYKLMLFAVVHSNLKIVLCGNENLSSKIKEATFNTIEELFKKADFDAIKLFYDKALAERGEENGL